MARGIKRFIYFILDRKSAEDAGKGMSDTLKKSGQEGGKGFFRELKQQFDKESAEIKVKLKKGLIDEPEAKRLGQAAGQAYNRGLLSGMDQARAAGALTDAQFIKMSRTLKDTGDAGMSAFGRIGFSLKNLMATDISQFIGAAGIIAVLKSSNDQANLLDASQRQLAAAAKLSGTEFTFLAGTSAQARENLRLTELDANGLTISLSKLAAKAGDVGRTYDGISALLDLGAAQGLTTAQALEAIEQTIRGQDEGLDKLLQKNPSQVYKEWAAAAGISAGAMTEAQKAQSILDAVIEAGGKVRGEYQKWLETSAGQQYLLTANVKETQAALGKALQPTLVALFPALTWVSKGVALVIDGLQRLAGIMTAGVLSAYSGLIAVNNVLTRSYAAVVDAAASAADFIGLDGTSDKLHARAAAIRAEASALDALAEAAREVAKTAWYDAIRPRAAGGAPRAPSISGGGGSSAPVIPAGGGAPAAAAPTSAQGIGPLSGTPMQTFGPQGFTPVDLDSFKPTGVADAWGEAFQTITADANLAGDTIRTAFQAGATGGFKALANLAKAKVIENLAYAVEMGAKALGWISLGNVPSAAAAKASAIAHLTAAAKWGAGAALGSAISSSGGGNGGGTFTSGGNYGGRSAENAVPTGPKITVYIDPFNEANPVHQRGVRIATESAGERYGEMRPEVINARTGRVIS